MSNPAKEITEIKTAQLVHVEWAKKWSCVNFVTIFDDLNQIKLWGYLQQFQPVHPSEFRVWSE